MLAHIDSGQLKSLVAYWLTIKEPRLRHAHAERFSKSGVGVSLASASSYRKPSPNIRSEALPHEPCRQSARLKAESELLTGAANAIVKT